MKTTISSDVWETKRSQIASLYKEEEWPLKQVMKKIRSDNFNPTETQLRSRLKKWGVTKASRQMRKKSISRLAEGINREQTAGQLKPRAPIESNSMTMGFPTPEALVNPVLWDSCVRWAIPSPGNHMHPSKVVSYHGNRLIEPAFPPSSEPPSSSHCSMPNPHHIHDHSHCSHVFNRQYPPVPEEPTTCGNISGSTFTAINSIYTTSSEAVTTTAGMVPNSLPVEWHSPESIHAQPESHDLTPITALSSPTTQHRNHWGFPSPELGPQGSPTIDDQMNCMKGPNIADDITYPSMLDPLATACFLESEGIPRTWKRSASFDGHPSEYARVTRLPSVRRRSALSKIRTSIACPMGYTEPLSTPVSTDHLNDFTFPALVDTEQFLGSPIDLNNCSPLSTRSPSFSGLPTDEIHEFLFSASTLS